MILLRKGLAYELSTLINEFSLVSNQSFIETDQKDRPRICLSAMEDKIMKPYPLELRLRVVAAYEEGQGTIAEIAALFHVGLTFIIKMIGRSRNGEGLEPKHGGGAKPSLNEVNLEVLRAAVETHPDATLGELKWFLRTDRGVKVSAPDDLPRAAKIEIGAKKNYRCKSHSRL